MVVGIQITSYGDVTPVNDRTSQVRDVIVAAVSDVTNAEDVTETHLAAITSLNLRNVGITELQSGDFSGLTALTNLNLFGNQLSSLPDGIFGGLTALTTLRLGANTVDPLPIAVSLQRVEDVQFKAVVPIGAPYDIVVPVSATNGSIVDSATSLTISKGSTSSDTLSVSRTTGTTAAVTANIGTLPSLPQNHYGYVLTKSDTLPLEIIDEVGTTPSDTTPTPLPVIENAAPVFTDGTMTIRSIAENTPTNANIGSGIRATDTNNDILTYTLGGMDAASFDIDSTTGQLKTKVALDYETKRVYIITITASDSSLTDTITVIISIIDVADTSIVTATLPVNDRTPEVRDAIVDEVPEITDAADVTDTHLATITSLNLRNAGITELKTGDFGGLTGLTILNLYDNMLSSLPIRIFDGLTSLTSLRLGGNLVVPFPLIVSLQQVSAGQFKAVMPTGAPFDVTIQINDSMVTIPKGSVESTTFTATTEVNIGTLPSLPPNHFGYILAKSAVCNRTLEVTDAITAAVPDVSDCNNVTEVDIAMITTFNLSNKSITSFQANDFVGMLSLSTLDLSNNELTNIPNNIFRGLASLHSLDLSGNSVDPMSLLVSLEKVGINQVKAVVPTGAPFDITLPITVVNGTIDGTTLTITTGNVESQTLTVTRTASTTDAVVVSITLPSLPTSHRGYALVKSNQQPLEVFEDINIAPIFTEGATTARTIAENTEGGTNIGTPISATDTNDDTLIYTLSGTDAASYDIDDTTGQLKTKAALDYETKSSYSVIITVSDGTLSDTINVTISVTDIQENRAPVFTEGSSATRTVAENKGSGVNIGTAVAATDADNDTLTYSLDGTDASAYSLNTTTGQLRTDAALDYETKSSYSVTITVSDGNGGSDTITVTINITDINEVDNTVDVKDDIINKVPVFSEGETATRAIAENTSAGVDIGTAIAANDADADTLIYTLGGTDAAAFSINSTNGQLRTSASLDFETKSSYTLTVSVSDGNGGSDSITVTITITDVDETPANIAPEFTDGSSTTRAIAENTGAGVDIGTPIAATDADADALTYTLGGTDAAAFSINSTNGQLRTSASLDYETKSSYTLTVSVSDGNEGSDAIIVTITLTDVDETPENNSPVFSEDNTTRTVAENTNTDTNIDSPVSATDADEDTLTYSLNGTDADSFDIESSTRQLKTKAELNHEVKSSYTVTVNVSDGQGGSDSIDVTIEVTDVNEAPVFADGSITTRTIAENAGANINIGSVVSATDVDADTTLTYSLGGTDAADFDIEPTTGQLKTKAVLDYETKNSYTVIITVSDSSLTDTVTVTINIRDLDETPSNIAPVFTDGEATTRSVPENTATDTDIGTAIAATDEDSTTLAYLLSGTDASTFSIDEEIGQLKTSAALNYEDKTSYTLTVTVSDGSLDDEITVTINVTNVNEAPVFADGESTTRRVPENTDADENFGQSVSATDPDAGDTLTYSLEGTDASSFDIEPTTGQLKTKAALDFETKESYSVTVKVTDSGARSDTIAVTINVRDVDENRAPVFTDGETATRTVAENTGAGVDVGNPVAATDADNDTLQYTLGGTDAGTFNIGSTTGQLRTKDALDYEDTQSYIVTITVSDGNNASDTITVTINVTDVDENRAPVITDGETATRTVAENTGAGVDIGNPVAATDADEDTLTYTLGGTDAAAFNIGSTTGQLRTKDALDYEDTQSYTVTITVSDGNNASDTITVTINVTDVDENRAPVFTDGETATRTVAENTGAGVDIGNPVAATDADEDTLTYTLGGTDAAAFNIGSTTGQLRTKDALDYEDTQSYTVMITVSDGNNASDTITVTINVTDVDENRAPVFTDGETATRAVAENTGAVVDIGNPVAATDADNDTLTYSLGSTDAAAFSIDSTTGQLLTKDPLNYENDNVYTVTITVSDDNGGEDTIMVTISVMDANDAPVFSETAPVTRAVDENTAAAQNIGTPVSATDEDGDTLEYSLGGTDASAFSIVSTSGQLKTSAALDYESKSPYSVTVTATDDSADTFSSDITVIININDVNEAPVFSDATANRSIDLTATGVGVGSTIGNPVTASDDDGDSLTYSISGTGSDKFDIDSSSGQLKVTQNLIDDTESSYTITVTAKDADLATDTIDVTISVTHPPMAPNVAPEFTDGVNTIRTIDENTAANQNIGTPIAATDQNSGDTLTYALSGTDSAKFDLDTHTGQLKTEDILNYEDDNSHSVTITVSDGNNGIDSIEVTINVNDANDAPQFTEGTTTTRNVRDDTASGVNIGDAISATDEDNDTLTYSLDGTDASSFGIVTTTGQLQTSSTLDHETQSEYRVTVSAVDENMGTASIDVTINVISSDTLLTPISDRSDRMKITLRDTVRALPGVDDSISISDITAAHMNQITSIVIHNNRTEGQLQSGDFDDLPALTSISMYNQRLNNSSIPSDIFAGLSALTTLDMSFNDFTILPSGIFAGLSALTDLNISYNDIKNLPSGIFAGLPALTDLNISYNDIKSLPSGIFAGLSALTTLDIDNNHIDSIASDIFAGLSALTTLDFSYNHIDSIASDIFAGLSALTTLDFSFNHLSSLPSGIFAGLSALTTLDFNCNHIASIPLGIFAELSALTTLDMGHNNVTSLPSGFFYGLSSLTTLIFHQCHVLESVDVNLFEGLSQLTHLYMDDTKISSLPEGLFDNTPKLKAINLAQLPLSTLPSDIFDGLSELSSLRLNYSVGNSLTSLPSDVFDGLSLVQLRFNNNGLASLPDGIFKGLTSLIVLEVGDQRPDTNSMDLIDMDINVSLIDDGSGAFKAKVHTGAPTMIRVVVDVENGTIDGDTRTTVNIPAGSVESDSISVTRTDGTTDAVAVRMGRISEPVNSTGFVGYQLVKLTTTPLEIYSAGLGSPTVVSKPASPTITKFLPNFPNPFNPETWIPYQLHKPADVTLTIYDLRGVVVRELTLGHQPPGYYTNRTRAAHWDSRNNIGERVATGVYFCTIKAGNFTATRKMLIRK